MGLTNQCPREEDSHEQEVCHPPVPKWHLLKCFAPHLQLTTSLRSEIVPGLIGWSAVPFLKKQKDGSLLPRAVCCIYLCAVLRGVALGTVAADKRIGITVLKTRGRPELRGDSVSNGRFLSCFSFSLSSCVTSLQE